MSTHELLAPPADLAYTRLMIMRLEQRDGRRASRLLLDFLDARAEHQSGRLSDDALRAALSDIRDQAA